MSEVFLLLILKLAIILLGIVPKHGKNMPFGPVINLPKWVEEHRHLLVPPVANRLVFEQQGFYVMIVGGPNERRDYHTNAGAELFYQLEGQLELRLMHEGKRDSVIVNAQEMFLLPPRIAHSPQRSPGSIGLVVERKRTEEEKDGLHWYCDTCDALLYEEHFTLKDIEKDFPPVFARFQASPQRICQVCSCLSEGSSYAQNRYPHSHSS